VHVHVAHDGGRVGAVPGRQQVGVGAPVLGQVQPGTPQSHAAHTGRGGVSATAGCRKQGDLDAGGQASHCLRNMNKGLKDHGDWRATV
jgi:hypothetical protein